MAKAPTDKHGDIVAASVHIHKPGAMTQHGREEIARWLRRTANDLVKLGSQYNETGGFRARYMVAGLDDDPYPAKGETSAEDQQGQTGEAAPQPGGAG
jgi:hypothetical protein